MNKTPRQQMKYFSIATGRSNFETYYTRATIDRAASLDMVTNNQALPDALIVGRSYTLRAIDIDSLAKGIRDWH
jgi:hypothetical protein